MKLSRGSLVSLAKFGLVGGLTVAIDGVVYAVLATTGIDLDLAKGISFIVGAVFAYFANWRFTFGARRGRYSEALFVVVYLLALGLNVLVNSGVRWVLGSEPWALIVAFLVATGISAAWNFAGMSLFVFSRRDSSEATSIEPEAR